MTLAALKIGPVTVQPNLILAPMSGVTNSVFRQLIKRENPDAVGLLVTEFISIEALTRKNLQSMKMMRFAELERPLSIQIFGYDITRMVDAALMAQDAGADIVDINCGCPVPKVVRRGGGCELMRQPEHLAKILSSVSKALTVPLTLKIRAGWDSASRNALQIATIAEESGVKMVTVHGRTKVDMYRGLADWELISEIASKVSIPVVGSGDVVCAESARKQLARGVSGLMIGRAALSNPWVFSEIVASLNGQAITPRPASEIPRVLLLYSEMLLEDLPEKAVIGRLKQFASQVTRLVHGSAMVRKGLCTAKSVKEFTEIVERWRDSLMINQDSTPAFANEYFRNQIKLSVPPAHNVASLQAGEEFI